MSAPLSCSIAALSDEQRQRRAALAAQLAAATSATQELPDGYAFFFDDDALWMVAAEFVDLERRCCPFFTFTLSRAADNTITLRLTGPEGAREFIAAEVFGG